MRLPLRRRILLLAVVAPALLALATSLYLHHIAVVQARREANDSMMRAALVLEELLAKRVEALEVAGSMIARDPRFFAAVSLPGGASDPHVRSTVRGVALQFAELTHAGLFEVLDSRARVLASVRDAESTPSARSWLESQVLAGQSTNGVLVQADGHFLVVATPVIADRKVAGSVLLGDRIGPELASNLRTLTRSDVTFVIGGRVTGSTLEDGVARDQVLQQVAAGRPAATDPIDIASRGDVRLTLIRPLPGAGGADQWVVLQRSMNTETAYMSTARQKLLTMAVLAILGALALGVWISGRITGPLRQLVRGAEEMERGNYEAEIDVWTKDEVGYLGARFRAMRSHERDYIKTLQEVARIKSEFIDVASHALRTPISVIKGYRDLFDQGALGPLTPRQQQALLAIEQSLNGLIRITEDAERIALIQGERLVLDRTAQDLGTIVGDAATQATQEAPGRRVTLEVDLPDDLPRFHVDGPRMTLALTHLARNAIRFTPDGGEVRIRGTAHGRGLVITVEDNGVGIPAERQSHLFERSFMLRSSSHHHSSQTLEFGSAGLGLGLGIARGIVEAHEGTLTVVSEPGRGSTFTIRVAEALVGPDAARGEGHRAAA